MPTEDSTMETPHDVHDSGYRTIQIGGGREERLFLAFKRRGGDPTIVPLDREQAQFIRDSLEARLDDE